MKRFEYKEITVTFEKEAIVIRDLDTKTRYNRNDSVIDIFNHIGKDGWELISGLSIIGSKESGWGFGINPNMQTETSAVKFYFKREK